ncbi:MAG: tetratricopeptide repeat protein [Ardenticatenia bacterium]|nr:tetratricopeptide repeat protein [Ardenticatenia bacterium]
MEPDDALDPVLQERVRSFIEQGRTAAQAGQRELARRYLHAAIEIDPDNADAWLWLAGVQDDPLEAKRCLERVLELDPNNAQAQRGLEWVEAQLAEQGIAPEEKSQATPSRSIHQELRAHLRTSASEQEEAVPSLTGPTTAVSNTRFSALPSEDLISVSPGFCCGSALACGLDQPGPGSVVFSYYFLCFFFYIHFFIYIFFFFFCIFSFFFISFFFFFFLFYFIIYYISYIFLSWKYILVFSSFFPYIYI